MPVLCGMMTDIMIRRSQNPAAADPRQTLFYVDDGTTVLPPTTAACSPPALRRRGTKLDPSWFFLTAPLFSGAARDRRRPSWPADDGAAASLVDAAACPHPPHTGRRGAASENHRLVPGIEHQPGVLSAVVSACSCWLVRSISRSPDCSPRRLCSTAADEARVWPTRSTVSKRTEEQRKRRARFA